MGFDGFVGLEGLNDAEVVALIFASQRRWKKIKIGFPDDEFGSLTESGTKLGVGEGESAIEIFSEDMLGEMSDQGEVKGFGMAECLFGFLLIRNDGMELGDFAAEFKLGDDLVGEGLEGVDLRVEEAARLAIGHAKSADGEAVWGAEGVSGKEPEVGRASDQRMLCGAGVCEGVFDFEEVCLGERNVTDGMAPGDFVGFETDASFEPMSEAVSETDPDDGSGADLTGQFGELVEILFRRRTEDAILIEDCQAFFFTCRIGNCDGK